MGLFSRFKRALKANINDMISKAENPEKMLNELIVEMNGQLIESKKQVAQAIADEKKLERQLRKQKAMADEWEQKAVLAVKAGRDDLAKEALLRKQEYSSYVVQYEKELQSQHEAVEQLKESLRKLQIKIDEAQRKKNLLIARAKRAEAQKRIHEQLGKAIDTSAFEAFDRMAEKVDQLEAEAEAVGELENMEKPDTLEEEFRKLESPDTSTDQADRMLEDLKEKLKKLEDKHEE